jgi:hypothetical protein
MDDLALAIALWGDPAVTGLLGGPFTPEQVDQRASCRVRRSAAISD